MDCWMNVMVAQFIGQIPNFSLFQILVNVLWGVNGEVNVWPTSPNLFIIQFFNSFIRDRVLEIEPWHIQNKPLIMRKWEPCMKTLEFNMTKLSIWIHLGNVPLELCIKKWLELHC